MATRDKEKSFPIKAENNNCCTDSSFKGWLTVAGGFLIHLSLGTLYCFGNLTPYLTSYIRAYSSPASLTYGQSVWIFAMSGGFQGVTMFLGGIIYRKYGPKITTLLGGWIMSLGVFMTYFTIKWSFYGTLLTYGIVFGSGVGIAYAVPLQCGMKWLPNNKGLVNGIILAGFGGGAFIFNQVQTQYINPDNISPDLEGGYFSMEKAKDLLDRVPNCFIVIGACYATLQLIGAMMLSEPKVNIYQLLESEEESLLNEEKESGDSQTEPTKKIKRNPKGDPHSMHPYQVIKTRAFHTLWWMFLLQGQVVVFISSLYKTYGQTFIKDDHFLSLVGSFSSVFNSLGRPVWGAIADRFSFKLAMIIMNTTVFVFMMTLIATPHGGKIMFFIWICAIFGGFCGNFALFPTATGKAFGPNYVAINYGLVFTSQAVTGPLGAILTSTLSDSIGWFWMFTLVSGFTFIGLILTLTFNVKRDGKDI